MIGVAVLAYLFIAGGSLVYCAARNLQSPSTSGNDAS